MKTYVKPTFEFIELRVEERIAVKCHGRGSSCGPEKHPPNQFNVS